MATERIETLISKEALGQFDELNAKLALSVVGFEKLVAKGVEVNRILGGAKTFKQVVDGTKELEAAEKNLAKANDDLAKNQAKLQSLYTEEAKKLAELKVQQQQRNQALKEEVQLNQAAEGSIKQKQIQLKQLQKTYDELSGAERKAASGQELLKSIQQLDKEVKNLEGDTGRFQRNVGNYANAFAGAFGSVNGELRKIRQQINSGNIGGQQLSTLQRQEQLLAQVTEQLGQEFSSTRQQSRAFQEAVAQIGLEFGHQSEVFTNFKNQVGESVDTLNDIRDSIKNAASDTRQLDRLIGAATAIAGGFGIAQGAAALFGSENEELQKTFVKLQAVMTILNGLQAIQNELKNKDSILRKLSNLLVREETKAIHQQAFAQTSNAAATETATKATNRFGAALKTIGIGLLLTLIPLIASAFSSMGSSAKKADKDLEGMGDTAEEIANTSIKELDDEIKKLNESMGKTPSSVDKAKKALQLLKQEGQNINLFGINDNPFDIDKIFSLETYKNRLKDIVAITGLTESRITENLKLQAELRAKIREIEFLEYIKKQEDALQGAFELVRKQIDNDAELDKDASNRRLDRLKKDFEKRKLSEDSFIRQSRAALQTNLNAELRIIQSNLELQLSEAGANLNKRKEAESDARKDRIIAERNFQDALTALIEEAESKRRKLVATSIQGLVEIQGTVLSEMARSLNTITGNSIPDRLKAFVDAFRAAKEDILSQLKELRKEVGLTALSTFESFVGASFDNEKNKVQEQIDLLEEKKLKEIEVANATIINTQDRAAAITAIEARAQARREQLERKQRDIDIQRAKFEKASAVLSIAIDTFQKVAAIRSLAAVLAANPITALLAPLALSQIPLVILGGALATAGILAQPIPKFATGTKDAPGGLSLVGDGGKSELVVTPKGEMIQTPAVPMVMNVPKHSLVYPDIKMLTSSMAVNAHGRLVGDDPDFKQMTNVLGGKIDKLGNIIKNKKELHVQTKSGGRDLVFSSGSNQSTWLNNNINR